MPMDKIPIDWDFNEKQPILSFNGAQVTHNPHDFIFVLRQEFPIMGEGGKVVNIQKNIIARYNTTPAMAKILLNVLAQNIKMYEDKYGEIATNIPENIK